MATREELNKEKQKKIIDEERKEKRKKTMISIFKITIISFVIIITFFLYTTYISNKKIIVKETRITSKDLPKNFNGVKLIQFSDVHYGTTISKNELKEIVELINERNPDIVTFTGDFIDKNYKINSTEQEQIINILQKIKTNIGKYAISGDEDQDEFTTIFNQSGFTILNNDYDLIYKDNNNPMLIIGINSTLNKNINIDEAYKYFSDSTHNTKIYTIVLAHEPDIIDEIIPDKKANLFLAGHSHNGQIKIPYFGAITRKEGAKKYMNEHYKINNTEIYISSGLGTNGNGIRFLCHPSINFFRISSE